MSKLVKPKMPCKVWIFFTNTGPKFGFGNRIPKLPLKLLPLTFPPTLKNWNTLPSVLIWWQPWRPNCGGKRREWTNGRVAKLLNCLNVFFNFWPKFTPLWKWVVTSHRRGVGVSRPMSPKLVEVLNRRTTVRLRFLVVFIDFGAPLEWSPLKPKPGLTLGCLLRPLLDKNMPIFMMFFVISAETPTTIWFLWTMGKPLILWIPLLRFPFFLGLGWTPKFVKCCWKCGVNRCVIYSWMVWWNLFRFTFVPHSPKEMRLVWLEWWFA